MVQITQKSSNVLKPTYISANLQSIQFASTGLNAVMNRRMLYSVQLLHRVLNTEEPACEDQHQIAYLVSDKDKSNTQSALNETQQRLNNTSYRSSIVYIAFARSTTTAKLFCWSGHAAQQTH